MTVFNPGDEPAVIARPSSRVSRSRWLATPALAFLLIASTWSHAETADAEADAQDHLKRLQTENIASSKEKRARAYHFGSQGSPGVFSNHTSHSNRLIPVYVFGKKADLGSVTGKNSVYRSAEGLRKLYGFAPENTLNPEAEYCDQSDLRKVMSDAVERGARHVFIVWYDGLDWPTTQAAAIAKTGKVYTEGKGAGLIFQDYDAAGSAQFGYYVTAPTYDQNDTDLDLQTVKIPAKSRHGGYDVQIAGPNPWTLGPLGPQAPGYLKGQSANSTDETGVRKVGRILHPYTDSAPSAAEFISGRKAYNNGINTADDGQYIPTLFHVLQDRGWKTGTVTSVPFDHASPSAMYAHNVHRDDYQDLARDMLGLPSIAQQTRRDPRHPGLDVVIGTGFGREATPKALKNQGKNAAPGNAYLADADRAKIDVKNGGKYVVVQTESGVDGGEALQAAADRAAENGQRLFGFYGSKTLDHLPYRTADGRFDPAPDVDGKAESYTPDDLKQQPSLTDMTRAALTVLGQSPKQPFILFVEAGDVDFALHRNNLDNAVGAIYSGEDAIKTIIAWVEKNSNWDDSVLVVGADHGHYLVIDDPKAIAGK